MGVQLEAGPEKQREVWAFPRNERDYLQRSKFNPKGFWALTPREGS